MVLHFQEESMYRLSIPHPPSSNSQFQVSGSQTARNLNGSWVQTWVPSSIYLILCMCKRSIRDTSNDKLSHIWDTIFSFSFFFGEGCCCWDRVSKMRSLCSWAWPLLLIHAWITGMCYHVEQQPLKHEGYFYPKIPLKLRPETNKMARQINFNHRDNKSLANDSILKHPHKNPQKLRHCLFLLIAAGSKLN